MSSSSTLARCGIRGCTHLLRPRAHVIDRLPGSACAVSPARSSTSHEQRTAGARMTTKRRETARQEQGRGVEGLAAGLQHASCSLSEGQVMRTCVAKHELWCYCYESLIIPTRTEKVTCVPTPVRAPGAFSEVGNTVPGAIAAMSERHAADAAAGWRKNWDREAV